MQRIVHQRCLRQLRQSYFNESMRNVAPIQCRRHHSIHTGLHCSRLLDVPSVVVTGKDFYHKPVSSRGFPSMVQASSVVASKQPCSHLDSRQPFSAHATSYYPIAYHYLHSAIRVGGGRTLLKAPSCCLCQIHNIGHSSAYCRQDKVTHTCRAANSPVGGGEEQRC